MTSFFRLNQESNHVSPKKTVIMNMLFTSVIALSIVAVAMATDFESAGKAVDNANHNAAAWIQGAGQSVKNAGKDAVHGVEHAAVATGQAAKNVGKGAVRAVGGAGESAGNWIAGAGQSVKNAAAPHNA
jgi:hypothetical protein